MNSDAPISPRDEYRTRLDEREQVVDRMAALDDRLSAIRGVVFLTGVGLFLWGAASDRVDYGLIAAITLIFAVLVAYHGTIVRRLARARRACTYYETALARLDGRWRDVGPTGARYSQEAHCYADDLDLFGTGSLFQLLNQARTQFGEDQLAEWLRQASTAEEIQLRQAVVRELRRELDLREQFAMLDAEVHDEIDQTRLRTWAGIPGQTIPAWARRTAFALGAAAIASVLCWIFVPRGHVAVILVLLAEIPFLFLFRRPIREVADAVGPIGGGLAILSQALELIENHEFNHPHLQQLQLRLSVEGQPPSVRIQQLQNRIQSLNNCLQNQFFAPIALLLCLPMHLVHSIELWRQDVGTRIDDWLNSVGEVEALLSLARFHFERPEYVFPEIATDRLCLEGQQMGHPLLPASQCVRNDLMLNAERQLILISGSNMSGKSTLLRTVGVNSVLALAGAPVCAERLLISVVQLGSAMRISDSLQDGKSLFYAVISRLKSIVELTTGPLPVLFLLDEILQGTNSHDRRIGAEGVIRRFLEADAIGLVTTHDLALTEIVDSLPAPAANFHFEDRLVDGKMSFDYQMRAGVVQKSNALELMRMMGLDV